MKVKKVRQIATPNISLGLSGVKYLLLSFCFVSSLHQTLPSHFEVWYSFAKKWFRPNGGFSHKNNMVVDGGPKTSLYPYGPIAWKGGSFRHFCAENRSVRRRNVVALRSLLSYLPASLAPKSLLSHLPASLGTVHKSRDQGGKEFLSRSRGGGKGFHGWGEVGGGRFFLPNPGHVIYERSLSPEKI